MLTNTMISVNRYSGRRAAFGQIFQWGAVKWSFPTGVITDGIVTAAGIVTSAIIDLLLSDLILPVWNQPWLECQLPPSLICLTIFQCTTGLFKLILVLISKFQLKSKVMSHVDLTFHSNQHLLTLGTRKLNLTPECETTCYRYSFHNDSQVKFRNFISQFITICFTVALCWLTYNLGNLHLNIKNL